MRLSSGEVWTLPITLPVDEQKALGEAQFVVNTLTKGKQPARDGFRIRRESVENGVACLTSLDTAEAILRVLESMSFRADHMPAIKIAQKAAVRRACAK